MVAILMISAELATLGFHKIKVFWNKGYEFMISVHDLANKMLSCDSNYIVQVSCDQSLKFNNLGLTLAMALKFYTSVAEELKLKFKKVWGTDSYVCRSYRGKAG